MKADLDILFTAATDARVEDIPVLLGKLRELEARLLHRLYAPPNADRAVQGEQLLDVEQAAERLKISTDYLYRHWQTLPFARKFAFGLRFSERGLNEYIRNRQR